MALPAKVLVGAAAFSTAVYSGFTWAKSQQQLKQVAGSSSSTTQAAAHQACHDGGCAFDRLAGVYDDIVGWEETSMFYGLLRWWLVRKAEVSVRHRSGVTPAAAPSCVVSLHIHKASAWLGCPLCAGQRPGAVSRHRPQPLALPLQQDNIPHPHRRQHQHAAAGPAQVF